MSAARGGAPSRPRSTGTTGSNANTAKTSNAHKASANMSAALAKLEKQLAGLDANTTTGASAGSGGGGPKTGGVRGGVSAGGQKKSTVAFAANSPASKHQLGSSGGSSNNNVGWTHAGPPAQPTKVSSETESILDSIESFDLFNKGGSGSGSGGAGAARTKPRPPVSDPSGASRGTRGQSGGQSTTTTSTVIRSGPTTMASSGVGGDEELPPGALWGAPPSEELDVWGNPLNTQKRGRLGAGVGPALGGDDEDDNPRPHGTVYRQLTAEEVAQRAVTTQQQQQGSSGPKTASGANIKVVRAGSAKTTRIGPEFIQAVSRAATVSKQEHSPLYFLHLHSEIERRTATE